MQADIQAMLDAAPAWGTVTIPPGSYAVSRPLVIRRPIHVSGFGATLTAAALLPSMPAMVDVASPGVTLRGLSLRGTRHVVDAVRVIGTAQNPITSFKLISCELSGCWSGLLMLHVVDFTIRANVINDVFYAGMLLESAMHGTVAGNFIYNVTGSPNAYGIAITRLTGDAGELTANPRSSCVRVIDNRVSDVPHWEGIDTHAGEDLLISGNRIERCRIPINVGTSRNATGVYTYAPQRVTVRGNHLDSDGAGQVGLYLTGCANSLGDQAEERAEDCVIADNYIYRCGDWRNATGGGVQVYGTRRVRITENMVVEPSPHGIVLYHDNYDAAVDDNVIVDPWRSVAGSVNSALGIRGASWHNTGRARGDRLLRGSKVAPMVGTKLIHVTPHPSNNLVSQ